MVFAFFGLYTLVVVGVLLANSVAIINERFLKQFGWHRPSADAPPTVQNRVLTLLYGDVKLLLQMPLIWINAVVIVCLLIFG